MPIRDSNLSTQNFSTNPKSEAHQAPLTPTSNPSIAASITLSENPFLTNRLRHSRITSNPLPDSLTSAKATIIRFPIASNAGRTVPAKSDKASP